MFVIVHKEVKTDGDWRDQHVYSFDVKSITQTVFHIGQIWTNSSFLVEVRNKDSGLLIYR